MGIYQSFILALKSLLNNKMRAFLTMLGIIIGVGAVIITVLTSNGILEIILASIVIPALVRALKPAMERMGFYDK